MADFVIVIAAAAALAGPAVPGSAAPTPATPSAAAASVPLNAPTVGFRTYPEAASCEQATAGMVAPPVRASFACRSNRWPGIW